MPGNEGVGALRVEVGENEVQLGRGGRAVLRHGPDLHAHRTLHRRAWEVLAEGRGAFDGGHREVAARYFAAVPEGVGATAEAKLYLGRIRFEAEDVAGAREAYEAAARADARSYAAAVGLASVEEAERNTEAAIVRWRRAAQLRPSEILPWERLAELLARLGRVPEARDACLRILAIRPDHGAARKMLGE